MELVYSKAISGCVVFILTLVCGLLPYFLMRPVARHASRRTGEGLNLMQSGAAGVFIATCLLHLLPEARESLDAALDSDLPVVEMIVSFGFLLLLVTEQMLVACHSSGDREKISKSSTSDEVLSQKQKYERPNSVAVYRRKPTQNGISHFRSKSALRKRTDPIPTYYNYGTVDDSIDINYQSNVIIVDARRTVDSTVDRSAGIDDRSVDTSGRFDDSDSQSYTSDKETDRLLESDEDAVIIQSQPNRSNASTVPNDVRQSQPIRNEDAPDMCSTTQSRPIKDADTVNRYDVITSGAINRHDSPPSENRDENKVNSERENKILENKTKESDHIETAVLKSFVLMMALSLHTVFDGLVIGLQDSHRGVWTLLAAIGLHKALIAVSISLSLLVSHRNYPRASFVYLVLFSFVAPLGVLVGTMLTETDFDKHAQNLTSGILQSIATGTFMYVTFVECLRGRFDSGQRLLNVLLVLLGFGIVCTLRVLLPS